MSSQEVGRQITLRNGEQVLGTYAPTLIESAFDRAIQDIFDTPLNDGYINDTNDLIRVSDAVNSEGNSLVFQYTRFNILNSGSSDKVVSLLSPHNLVLRKSFDDLTSPEDAGTDPMSDEFFDRIETEEKFVESILQRILDRDGKINPFLAVTDPTYFTEGTPIKEWPERIAFAIFDSENVTADLTPSGLERRGHLDDIRPRVYGFTTRGSLTRWDPDDEREMVLTYPQALYEAARAYVVAFDKDDPSKHKFGGWDVEDYIPINENGAYNRQYLGLEIPIFGYRLDPSSIQDDIRNVVVFAGELAKSEKQT